MCIIWNTKNKCIDLFVLFCCGYSIVIIKDTSAGLQHKHTHTHTHTTHTMHTMLTQTQNCVHNAHMHAC